jgi:hypothetical protein
VLTAAVFAHQAIGHDHNNQAKRKGDSSRVFVLELANFSNKQTEKEDRAMPRRKKKSCDHPKSMILIGLICVAMLFVAACSSSSSSPETATPTPPDDGTPTTPTITTLAGTAAAGAPIKGTVYLRDASGTLRSDAIGDAGGFEFDIEGLTAPFLLWSDGVANGKEAFFYSMAVAGGRANITPATHCIMAMALGENPVPHYRANPLATPPEATDVDSAKERLSSLFSQLFKEAGVAEDFDLMHGEFDADGSGFDQIMDIVDMNADDVFVTILDRYSLQALLKQRLTDGLVEEEKTPAEVEELCLEGLNALDDIKAILETIAEQFATSIPTYDALADVLLPLMTEDFTELGLDREGRLQRFVDRQPVGAIHENIALHRRMKAHTFGDLAPFQIDELPQGYDEGVWCTYTVRTEKTFYERIGAFVRAANGTWKWHGDRYPFASGGIVEAESVWVRDPMLSIYSGLRFRTDDWNLAAFDRYGIESFMVVNSALPEWTSSITGNTYNSLILSKDPDSGTSYNITTTGQTWGGRHFERDGLDINAISDNEFIFVGFDSSSNPVHVWIDLLNKKPLKEAALWKDTLDSASPGEFSSYFSKRPDIGGQPLETIFPEAALAGNPLQLSWEIAPLGEYVDWVEVGLRDSGGWYFRESADNPNFGDTALQLADWTSTTLDFTDHALVPPLVNGHSYLQTRDEFQRRYHTQTNFTVVDQLPASSITAPWTPYLQYRTFEDPSQNQFRGNFELDELGLPAKDVITDIRLLNLTSGTEVPIERFSFNEYFYWSNWSGNQPVNKLRPIWTTNYFAGYSVYFPAGTDITADDYQYVAETGTGETIELPPITFEEKIELPVVPGSSMQSEWVDGDLKLSWGPVDVPEQYEPQSSIRIWVVGGDVADFNAIFSISVRTDFNSVTIPKRMIENAKITHPFDAASWRIELRYSAQGHDQARGISNLYEIAGWE